MACLMIGRQLFLIICHHHRAALRAHHHLIFGFFKFCHSHGAPALTRCQQGCLIHQIGQISTRKTGRATGNHTGIHIRSQRAFAHMHFQDPLTAHHIRIWHHNLTVETAGTQQGRIQHIRTVRSRDQDNPFIRLKAVHFHQHLVQCLFPFIIAAAKTSAAMTTHRINLVNKDDTRGIFLALFKHVADTAGADADKHFHKV